MAKPPAIQFYVRDWTTDCNGLSVAAKGAWIQMLCQLHLATKRGELTKTCPAWARICGCSEVEFEVLLAELFDEEIARVTKCNGRVTVVSRRFERERKEREAAALRQRKCRAGQNGHENVTLPSAVAVSAAASATAKEAPPLSPSDDFPDIAGVERPAGRRVEVSEAGEILAGLVADWNAVKENCRLYLGQGESLERTIREKITDKGIPILEIPKFDQQLIAASVEGWRRHCTKIRREKGQHAHTPSWGMGYLASAWFTRDSKRHVADKASDERVAAANKAAQELVELNQAKDERDVMMATWEKVPPLEQNKILKGYRASDGPLCIKPIAIGKWWQARREKANP